MATTTNFGWETPDDTDLVKDGAAAIRTALGGVDTSFVDLKGGTTGQVLAKASNTDLDFVWSADAAGISPTIVDAKGDLIAASAADTPARLAVGNNGETLVADSSTATGLRYTGNYAAGKNKIINGDFGIWQRGTSFTLVSGVGAYTADRFSCYNENVGGSVVVSRQAFTPATAPVSGYEGQYFLRWTQTAGTSSANGTITQNIEDVRTFANQIVTLSYWAKADAARTITVAYEQYMGASGSGYVNANITTQALTTSWVRYTHTFTVPSLSGKTLGANSYLAMQWKPPTNTTQTIDIWGVQVEAGSTATAFQTATGTIQGELAACQRYYYQLSATNNSYTRFGNGITVSTSQAHAGVKMPVTMRTAPTLVTTATASNYVVYTGSNFTLTSVPAIDQTTPDFVVIQCLTSATQTINAANFLAANNSTAALLGFNSEL